MNLAMILFLTTLGSLMNDYYNILSEKEEKIEVPRIIIGGVTSALVVFTLMGYIGVETMTREFTLVSFVAGIGGFSFFPVLQGIKILDLITFFIPKLKDMKRDDISNKELLKKIEKIENQKGGKPNEDSNV